MLFRSKDKRLYFTIDQMINVVTVLLRRESNKQDQPPPEWEAVGNKAARAICIAMGLDPDTEQDKLEAIYSGFIVGYVLRRVMNSKNLEVVYDDNKDYGI